MEQVIIPLLIFLARVVDVSMGTLRIMFVSRGIKLFAAILGFFEVLIWLTAIGQIMKNLTSPWHYIAYAGGFAFGNYIGMTIEQGLSMGMLVLRIISREDSGDLVSGLIFKGYGVTVIDGEGATGPVKLIFTVLRRKDLAEAFGILERHAPGAFYTVEDVRASADRGFL
ncbi:MAG: DUF2179 domain-containing protein, partial [Candidatus Omnitrophica bacterium]|nr:DUF2179 domain-containing protein [Candidatus Omnitrophota bacterium]